MALAEIANADIILYKASPSYNANIYAQSGVAALLQGGIETLLRHNGPMFLYLWSPGS